MHGSLQTQCPLLQTLTIRFFSPVSDIIWFQTQHTRLFVHIFDRVDYGGMSGARETKFSQGNLQTVLNQARKPAI
jgi:hypothetical protein